MGMSLMNIGGINVFPNRLCETTEVFFEVVPHPMRKRRRNWQLRRTEKKVPTMLWAPNGIYVHPSIYEQLLKDTSQLVRQPN